jgi:Tol biopolymer transport system component
MIRSRLAALLFVPLMLAVGSGTYLYLGSLKSQAVKEHAQLPTVTKPKFVLPGTMYLAQAGRLFKMSGGNFTEIGPPGDWSQPALTPDHTQLVAVLRSAQSSDLYLLDLNGKVIKRLTKNDAKIIDANHWAYYPRVTPDGQSVTYSYDSPKAGFRVDFAIWTMPLKGTQSQARRRTDPYYYTGGDIGAVSLRGTAIIYVKNSVDSTGLHSQLWYQERPFAVGKALTAQADDCTQPALSPDGTRVAMICTAGKQTASLRIAPLEGNKLGPATVLLSGGLYASPTWSPDGKALAYFAPAGVAGHFQLWWLALPTAEPSPTAAASPVATRSASASATPAPKPASPAPMQVTQGVDLTATSPPAWY